MKNIRNLISLMLIVLLLSSCGLSKMVKNYEELDFEVTPKVLETKGGKIEVSIKGNIPEKYFHKKAAVWVTPELKYEGGSTLLKPVYLQGESVTGDGIVISKVTGGSFTYTDVIEYDPKMNVSELIINPIVHLAKEKINVNEKREVIKLKAKAVELGERKLADGVIYTSERIMHDEELYRADKKTAEALGMDLSEYYEKETIIDNTANIFFVVNMANLNLRWKLNKEEAAKTKLQELKDFVAKGWVIKGVNINAWASPDGEEAFNQGLSERRSKTANKYMEDLNKKLLRAKAKAEGVRVKDLEKPVVDYSLNAKGEDWDGFMKAVQKSDIADKNIILNVVKSQPDVTKREQEIRNMTVIYKEIADDILPNLRRAQITVSCFEPKKSDEEIAMLSTSDPAKLDNKEIIYAGTLTEDLNTQLKIYKSAIELYPNDWKTYHNVAYVNLMLENVDEATTYLEKAKTLAPNNPMVLNNLGAVAAKKKDYETALALYNSAQQLKANVNYNKGILQILDGEFGTALSSFSGKKCNYNVGLAKLMNDNPSGAATDLDCAKKNAQVYYLLAVVGARTNNTAMIYDNLKLAISQDDAYRAQAKDDREFLKYFETAEFKEAIK